MSMEIILCIIFILHLYFGLKFQKRIKESKVLGDSQKRINSIMIWIIPFVWFWLIKGMLGTKTMETMTKSKRKIDKSNFTESGIGTMGE